MVEEISRDEFFEQGVLSENIRIRRVFKQVLIERCKCSEFGECNFCMETKELFGKIFEDQRNICLRMKTMSTATDEELMKIGKDDLIGVIEDWGALDVTFKDEESYYDDGKACIAIIKSKYHKVEFEMRIECIDQKPSGREAHILFGEDRWEVITAENVWCWLFMYALDKIPSK
jgi:hypothetical protein